MDLNPFRDIIPPEESSIFSEILRHKFGRKLWDTYKIFEGHRDGLDVLRLGVFDYLLLGIPVLLTMLINHLEHRKSHVAFFFLPVCAWLVANTIRWLMAVSLTLCCIPIVTIVHLATTIFAKRDFELASKLEVISLTPEEWNRHYGAEEASPEERDAYIAEEEQKIAQAIASADPSAEEKKEQFDGLKRQLMFPFPVEQELIIDDIIAHRPPSTDSKEKQVKELRTLIDHGLPKLWVSKKNVLSRAQIMASRAGKLIADTLNRPVLDESVSHRYQMFETMLEEGDTLYIFDNNDDDYIPLSRRVFAISKKTVESSEAKPDQKEAWMAMKRLNLFSAGVSRKPSWYREDVPQWGAKPILPRISVYPPKFFNVEKDSGEPVVLKTIREICEFFA